MIDYLVSFSKVMPIQIKNKIKDKENLIDVVLDVGRKPEAWYLDGTSEYLDDLVITESDLTYICSQLEFGDDNRAGVEDALHRISAMRDRQGNIIGLTCRVGRAIEGSCNIIKDLIDEGKSILILGAPGKGKSARLRDISRYVSTELNKRVIIVDTSNEIAGYGVTPHKSVGKARRMQVPTPSKQYTVLLEAIENHTPNVIVVDEIGNREDVNAVRTIAERGVQLFGTAHGITINNIIDNPVLAELVGGIQTVTLSDSQALSRGCKKSILERKHNPTFDVIVELIDFDTVAIYSDVKSAVDDILEGMIIYPELRHKNEDGKIDVEPGKEAIRLLINENEFIAEKIKADQEVKSNGNGNKTSVKKPRRGR